MAGMLPQSPNTSTLVPIASEQAVATIGDGGQKFPLGQRQEERQRSNISRELQKLGF